MGPFRPPLLPGEPHSPTASLGQPPALLHPSGHPRGFLHPRYSINTPRASDAPSPLGFHFGEPPTTRMRSGNQGHPDVSPISRPLLTQGLSPTPSCPWHHATDPAHCALHGSLTAIRINPRPTSHLEPSQIGPHSISSGLPAPSAKPTGLHLTAAQLHLGRARKWGKRTPHNPPGLTQQPQ